MTIIRPPRRGSLLAATIATGLATVLTTSAQAPNITGHPVPQTVQVGDPASFSVTATGAAPLSHQWKFATTNLPGATTNPLVLPAAAYSDAGNYSVVVSNSAGTALSAKAALTVVSRELWAWGDTNMDLSTVPISVSNAVAVAAGGVANTVVRANGSPVAWGLGCCLGFTDAPGYLNDVHQVAAGYYHSLALRTNGTIVGWGGTEVGQFTGSWSWTNLVAVSAGANYCLGLRRDGTLALSGDPNEPASGLPAIPAGLSNLTAVAAGTYGHCLTLRGDGIVQSWGSQTNVPAGLDNVVAISCGENHKLALRADGAVVAWGDNSVGQTNVPAGATNLIAIACGQHHSLALRADGTVLVWGHNGNGQTNLPAFVHGAGSIGAGSAARLSLAAPAQGAPFITTRLADQVWGQFTPAVVFFRAEAAGARPLSFQWTRNGADLPGATNAVLQISDPVNKQGRYTVVVSNALGVATIPEARLLITVPQTPLQAALENYLPWTNGGNVAWFVQTAQNVDGVDAARSGAITHNQESWLETSVVGPGFLTYWWMVSSESDYDVLEFYLDGNLQPGRISGNVAWQQRIAPITSGNHTLRWRYSKDAADSAGLDAGFLDYVSFASTLPAYALLPNGTFQLSFAAVPATAHTIVASTNITLPLASWPELGSPTEISPGQFVFTDPTAPNIVRRYYRVRSP